MNEPKHIKMRLLMHNARIAANLDYYLIRFKLSRIFYKL